MNLTSAAFGNKPINVIKDTSKNVTSTVSTRNKEQHTKWHENHLNKMFDFLGEFDAQFWLKNSGKLLLVSDMRQQGSHDTNALVHHFLCSWSVLKNPALLRFLGVFKTCPQWDFLRFQHDPAQPSAQHKGFLTIDRHLNSEWIDDHHSMTANI